MPSGAIPRTIGERLWDRFNAPKDDQLWYYHAIVFALQDAQSDERVTKVLNELIDVVRQMRELSGGLNSQELLTESGVLCRCFRLSSRDPVGENGACGRRHEFPTC